MTVDLTNCDREPIHIPGTIQPHGVLLALSPSLTVMQTSANVSDHLGLAPDVVLGATLEQVLGARAGEVVAGAIASGTFCEANPRHVVVRDRRFDLIVHFHEGVTIVELEASSPRQGSTAPLLSVLSAMEHARTLADVCGCVVDEVKRLTGFERVMLYRFDDDGHGSVDAEARDPSLDAYLGLRYPASDIPQQARALYLQNWLRVIPDARYTPARLVPAMRPDTGAPLDLSFSVLRSVSPIHLEYLANMGIRASMSISLIVEDRLWGLISCGHHSGPLMVPYEVRCAVEVIGRLLSLQIAALAHRDAAERRVRRQPIHEDIVTRVRRGDREEDVLAAAVSSSGEQLLALVDAAGVAAVIGDEVVAHGRVPPVATVGAIAGLLDRNAGLAPFATDRLAQLPDAPSGSSDVASGVLSFCIPGTASRRLLWFRPEIVRTVTWGGDPRKPVEADRGMRLHPRRSFEQWKEEVRDTSRRWSASDVEAADEVRRALVEIDLDRRLAREQRAVQLRDDLVAIVSHDLRNPLGLVHMQSSLLIRAAAAPMRADAWQRIHDGAERIRRAAERMATLIRDLLDVAKIESGRFQLQIRPEPIADIVNENILMIVPQATAKNISVQQEVLADGIVRADRERVFQILSNLLGNAVKFTPNGGTVKVRVETRGREVLFTVADTGTGIAPDDAQHVFERYWHRNRGAKEGTGLGLFIAKGLVEAHGGTIWVESARGAGARFMFTLPQA
ncbi:MAG TPA: ATP-binding protein [Polyangia bacterium]|nr:ATP-binding protein [Polyangia bacterium]